MDDEGTRHGSAYGTWSSGRPTSLAGRRTALVLAVALGFLFLLAGLTKLMGEPMHFENFERWGYSAAFVYVVGFGETLAAVLLLIPRTRFWGAAGIVLDMTGAVLTHINADEWSFVLVTGVLLFVAAFLTGLTRPAALREIDASGSSAGAE